MARLLSRLGLLLAGCATMLFASTSNLRGADVNVWNPGYPQPTPVGNMGWDPGMTHGRAIHWGNWNGSYWPQYWVSCPDDAGGCSNIGTLDPQYRAEFDIGGSQTPGHPNSNEIMSYPGFASVPCPLYANWYGFLGARDYSSGINNYPWNKWNSPNIFTGLSQAVTFNGAANPRLDQVLLSFTLNAYLNRTYVQNGIAARGQGRILVGFVFHGANGGTYVIEMNFSNMRVNLNDHRHTSDYPAGAPMIPVSNPWRDDIWAEYIYSSGYSTYVLGARNPSWGYNLVEGQNKTFLFDPWWVVTSLIYRTPSTCPQALNNDGTQSSTDIDPGGYGVILCGSDASAHGLPASAIYDGNGNIGATFDHAYIGVEMGGSAVLGNADISKWTYQRRW